MFDKLRESEDEEKRAKVKKKGNTVFISFLGY